jgi:hypothetical protein
MEENTPYYYEFIIDSSNVGGSLNFNINNKLAINSLTSKKENILGFEIHLHACLMFNSMDILKKCTGGYKIKRQSFSDKFTSLNVNVAYPMLGKWYLALWKNCICKKYIQKV